MYGKFKKELKMVKKDVERLWVKQIGQNPEMQI